MVRAAPRLSPLRSRISTTPRAEVAVVCISPRRTPVRFATLRDASPRFATPRLATPRHASPRLDAFRAFRHASTRFATLRDASTRFMRFATAKDLGCSSSARPSQRPSPAASSVRKERPPRQEPDGENATTRAPKFLRRTRSTLRDRRRIASWRIGFRPLPTPDAPRWRSTCPPG